MSRLIDGDAFQELYGDLKEDVEKVERMKEYIEREAAKEEILSWAVCINHPELLNKEDTMYCIASLPAADVAPVRHGRWIGEPVDIDGHTAMECSECHKIRVLDEYCSSCGARMDKEAAHD